MVFFNCSKKPPCNCFQPCSITSCNASLPLRDDMGCLLSARLGRAVGRHPLSFYPHFQQKILQTAARESVGRLQRNRNEVMDPAVGALVVGDDQLERPGFAEGLAVASVGHEYFASVKTGIGFGDG